MADRWIITVDEALLSTGKKATCTDWHAGRPDWMAVAELTPLATLSATSAGMTFRPTCD